MIAPRAHRGTFASLFAVGLSVALGGSPARSAVIPRSIAGLPARGLTVGPIENAYHPGVGYGSSAFARATTEARTLGADWVAITPFGRVNDLRGLGVDLTFEAPEGENRRAVARAVQMAHGAGLKVMLVPHLWVESGDWRAQIDPGSDEGWARWSRSYEHFVVEWARIAQETDVDLFSVGVELRSWVTTRRAPSFGAVIRAVREAYRGPLTYSANWDDVEDTVILGDLDLIGINAFYPLAEKEGATLEDLRQGGARVREKVHALATAWHRPVLFTEMGYTTRPDPAVRPWEWPEHLTGVRVDEMAQAEAYHGLLGALLDEPDFAGFFAWRVYADPDDTSQEPEWGFSPRGKLAELVLRDAFAAPWRADERLVREAAPKHRYPYGFRSLVPGIP